MMKVERAKASQKNQHQKASQKSQLQKDNKLTSLYLGKVTRLVLFFFFNSPILS